MLKKTYSLPFLTIIFCGIIFISFNNYKAFAHAGSYGFAKIAADGETVKITLLIDSLSIAEFPGVDTNHDELGFEHIVTGYDHILFLLTLLFVNMKFRSISVIVTSFTLAHSITLILAVFEVVSLPTKFIEAMIALTIVYMAVENLLYRDYQHRWAITFVFGLIHGFGFAGALQGIGLPKNDEIPALFAFNFGVELGQLVIVLFFYSFLQKMYTFLWWS